MIPAHVVPAGARWLYYLNPFHWAYLGVLKANLGWTYECDHTISEVTVHQR